MIVQFLNVVDRQIVEGRIRTFKYICHGIAYFKNSLFITTYTVLYEYTQGGLLVKKIYEDTSGPQKVYKCAVSSDGSRLNVTNYTLDVTNNTLDVTNYTFNKLLTLYMNGTVLSSSEHPALQCPLGVHMSASGQLLVCGYRSCTIVQVDAEVGVVKLASKEDGLDGPESIYYRAGRLIVGQRSDNILVINTK
ncbi:hypothetical protein DPMN_087014 [Dreissena polymorpha]|uniref:Uncharacterized protein n=1 Tax=Dreissena polymorpha TaxID=45954 RepID=A0A9D4KT32_DREPO|nr:hypothetical protein DPMN_087014 [Dreissena polymorpha]